VLSVSLELRCEIFNEVTFRPQRFHNYSYFGRNSRLCSSENFNGMEFQCDKEEKQTTEENSLCNLVFLSKPISDITTQLNFELKEGSSWYSKINYKFLNGGSMR
jgi:hypothetical protein